VVTLWTNDALVAARENRGDCSASDAGSGTHTRSTVCSPLRRATSKRHWARPLRSLEESAGLSRRLAVRARGEGHELVAVRFEGREAEARRRIRGIRAELAAGGITTPRPLQRL